MPYRVLVRRRMHRLCEENMFYDIYHIHKGKIQLIMTLFSWGCCAKLIIISVILLQCIILMNISQSFRSEANFPAEYVHTSME